MQCLIGAAFARISCALSPQPPTGWQMWADFSGYQNTLWPMYNAFMYVYIHMYIDICMHVCIYVLMYIDSLCIYPCKCMCIYIYRYQNKLWPMYMQVGFCYVYIHTYIYMDR